jgi:hypothetical protein
VTTPVTTEADKAEDRRTGEHRVARVQIAERILQVARIGNERAPAARPDVSENVRVYATRKRPSQGENPRGNCLLVRDPLAIVGFEISDR